MCTLNMNDLQDKIIKSINQFSEIKQFEVKDDFIQKKLNQISEQEIIFRKFAEDYNLKMSTHADDLITFAESCEDENISSDELLKSLRKLNDDKINKNKFELLNQIESVKNSLDKIINEITEYNERISEGQTGLDLANKINKLDKDKDEAISFAKNSVLIVGIGTMVATAAIPFTAGTSLVLALPAKLIITLGMSLIVQGTTTATVSTVVAGASSIHSRVLNYKLKGVREQISQFLREMQKGIEDIDTIIKHCESNFEKQIAEIEEVEKVVNIIKKLDDKHLVKPIARTISTRARKNSKNYSVDLRQDFNIDSILPGFADKD